MKKKTIEQEAKEFQEKKKPRQTYTRKTLTPRQQLAGMVLSGLLANGHRSSQHELKIESFRWADIILEEE